MIALIQRVKTASVTVSNETVSTIGNGMLIFLGVAREDTEQDAEKTAEKIVNLRMFEDSTGKMNISIRETKGEILVVSQFTLVANLKGGRRPDFSLPWSRLARRSYTASLPKSYTPTAFLFQQAGTLPIWKYS
jgi:D-tyrosyl-tRNA(Tyr) deacylase